MVRGAMYGFFSAEAARCFGTIIYSTPNGQKVEVTCIWSNREAQGYLWKDKVCVGEVAHLVSLGRRGEYDCLLRSSA
jgi:hypothetical protein